MAANFWESSHAQQWLLSRNDLAKCRAADLEILKQDEYDAVLVYFCMLIDALAQQLKLKQQVAATAQVYLRRFYCRHSLRSIDPLLMAPTSLFLASKIEEYGVIPQQGRFHNTCQTVVNSRFSTVFPNFQYTLKDIQQCEFYLLESMDCCLIVFQPYRSLIQFKQDPELRLDQAVLNHAWHTVNDCAKSDICLTYPPFEIALAALHIGLVITDKDNSISYRMWFAELNIDLERILELTKRIFAFSKLWNLIEKDDYDMKRVIAKVPKPRLTPHQPSSSMQQSINHGNYN